CMEGTREDVLRTIVDWTANSSAANIFWLKGHPGVGKSAVAASFIDKLRAKKRLGACFFFQKEVCSMTPNALWRAVAYDLALHYPTVRKHVMAVLEEDETLPTTVNVERLFRELIHKPLTACGEFDSESAPVVVIDALDECGGVDGQHSSHRVNLMRTLDSWSTLPKKFKLVVTSRPDPDIERFLSTIQHESFELVSGKAAPSTSSEDIERFLEYNFGRIVAQSHGALPPGWPGRHIIERLTRLSGGLFIWVETVIRLLGQGAAQEQLNHVLEEAATGELATLYSSILQASFPNPTEAFLKDFHHIVGAIILAKDPLPASSLVQLCSVDDTTLSRILGGLNSVMDSGEVPRFSHQSFVEFLVDLTRCPPAFRIDLERQKQYITEGCLQVMKQHLRFNICDLESSYQRNCDIEDLDGRIKERIPSLLSYSSCHWADHLAETTFDIKIASYVQDLMQNQFLFWLEVLSLTERVDLGTIIIAQLVDWLRNGKQSIKMAMDMKKFLFTFRRVISQSVPHIYLSALPSSPRHSAIYNQCIKNYPQTIRIDTIAQGGRNTLNTPPAHTRPAPRPFEGQDNWVDDVISPPTEAYIISSSEDMASWAWNAETAKMASQPFEEYTRWEHSITFDSNGEHITSSSYYQKIWIWDAEPTMVVKGALDEPADWADSVVYSRDETYDGTSISSGSDDQSFLAWDPRTTARVTSPLQGHDDWVDSVPSSPDGRHFTFDSNDQTTLAWYTEPVGFIAGPFEGHTDSITSVSFSPDGTQIVTGSDDTTIRIWNAATGEMMAGPFQGHTHYVNSVAFSPDGIHIASGSEDHTVRVWNAQAVDVSKLFRGHTDAVRSVIFSPDGTRVVSGSEDHTVCVWDVKTGNMIAGPFEGHTGSVGSVAFSPDGRYVASGSDDNTICLWDVHTAEIVAGPFQGHTDCINSVAFSPDGRHIASASDDETIRVWDAGTGEIVAGPFEGHTDMVTSVVFSPDGTWIASGSGDETIRVWDATTAELVAGPYQGHDDWVRSVAFSPNGTRIVSGSENGTIRLWNIETADMIAAQSEEHGRWTKPAPSPPDQMRISTDSGGMKNWIRDGDMEGASLKRFTSPVSPVAPTFDGTRFISRFGDEIAQNWDVDPTEMVAEPVGGHTDSAISAGFSSDENGLLSSSNEATSRVWYSVAEEMDPESVEGYPSPIRSTILSFNETRVSGIEDKESSAWDGEPAVISAGSFEKPVNLVDSEVFSPDGAVDGWILGPDSELLLWVPPAVQRGLLQSSNPSIIRDYLAAKLNLHNFVHGKAWTRCKDPLPD
ncbi:hypothetical protein M408DRAFT_77168, partial [Serendipita vermifera MAFF 305830]